MNNPITRKLLTRREIIERWKEQSDGLKDTYCCPVCKSLLYREPMDHPTNLGSKVQTNYYCHFLFCSIFNTPILNQEQLSEGKNEF